MVMIHKYTRRMFGKVIAYRERIDPPHETRSNFTSIRRKRLEIKFYDNKLKSS